MVYNSKQDVSKLKKTCQACGKIKVETDFYTMKNGEKSDTCKVCETMFIDNTDPATFKPLLKKYDVPYIKDEWQSILQGAMLRKKKITSTTVIGKYLSKMRLGQYKDYCYEDTDIESNKGKIYKTRLEEIEESYKNGDLTEEQYEGYKKSIPKPIDVAGMKEDTGMEEIAQQVSNDLTKEDRLYLGLKWGKDYSAADWLWLEQKYNEYVEAFGLSESEASRLDNLVLLSKTSLSLNRALEEGDIDAVSKMSKAYETFLKAGKFAESQASGAKDSKFDSVGKIVLYAEQKKGRIEPYDLEVDRDYIDKGLKLIKNWIDKTFRNDSSISRKLDEYVDSKISMDKAAFEKKVEEEVTKRVKKEIERYKSDSNEQRLRFFDKNRR